MTRVLVMYSLLGVFSLCARPSCAQTPQVQWNHSESSIALVRGDHVLWQFNHGPDEDVPYFHPVSTADGRVLTWDRPGDHAWHHGLWFCWKYINGVNYWEHDRTTGRPAGRTEWSDVRITKGADHSANISMTLAYHAVGADEIVLREIRSIDISAPDTDGQLQFDWSAEFTTGTQQVVLDRTPPKDQSWGGYAGLSVRLAKGMADRQATTTTGPAQFDSGNRHRSHGTAMDYNGIVDAQPVGVAFLDHPDNPRHPTPWYVIRSPQMSYINAALLHNAPMTLQPGEQMVLRYRLIVHPGRWDASRLNAAQNSYSGTASSVAK